MALHHIHKCLVSVYREKLIYKALSQSAYNKNIRKRTIINVLEIVPRNKMINGVIRRLHVLHMKGSTAHEYKLISTRVSRNEQLLEQSTRKKP